MVHLSIGEVYAFSVFKNPLVERFGVGLTPIAIIFSISIVMLGLTAVVFGNWVERPDRGRRCLPPLCAGQAGLLSSMLARVDALQSIASHRGPELLPET